ncbi:unnamed protein product [Sphagnum jensenii]|jgi:hypothetical protein
MPTLEEIATRLEREKTRNANHNHHHDEEVFVLKFRKVLHKDKEEHMEDSTTKLAITMLEALKDLGILLSSLVIVVILGNMVIGQKSVQTLKRGKLPYSLIDEEDGVGVSNEQSDPKNVAETFEATLSTMVLETRNNTWIVDFGASTHVIGNAKILDEVKELVDQYNVKTANE